MTERKLYQGIPGGKNSYHSAVLTSFSFNFHHFEYQVLRALKEKWITSINIWVDQRMLDDALGLSSGYLKTISQAYSVSGIVATGAFHPKINFFIGDQRLLVLFGSGNITPGGHGKNHELFSGFCADAGNQRQLPLILETWQYLQSITGQLEGYARERVTQTLPAACSLLQGFKGVKHQFHQLKDWLEAALLYNEEDSSIFDQLCLHVPADTVERITVVCPYYDEDGSTLLHLRDHFPKADLEVYLQESFGLPPTAIPSEKGIRFYNWNCTERGEKKISGKNRYARKLHGKLFHFKAGGVEFCLIGSANATRQGLGGPTTKPSNYEFGALYKSSSFDFLRELGVQGRKTKIEVQKLTRPATVLGDLPAKAAGIAYRIKSVDLHGVKLKVYLERPIGAEGVTLVGYSINGGPCFEREVVPAPVSLVEFYLTEEQLKTNPKYCCLTRADGAQASNKQLINYLYKLEHTNPAGGNRFIRQLTSKIEGGQFNEFEIAAYLNELYASRKSRTTAQGASGKKVEEASDEDGSQLTYEEAVAAAGKSSDLAKIINSHSSTRIWDSLAHLFETRQESLGEELMDEEEEGEAGKGRERKAEDTTRQQVGFKTQKVAFDKLRSVEKMTKNYLQSIRSVQTNTEHQLDILDYHSFLLVSHLLTTICCFTDYSLPQDLSEAEWQHHLENLYREQMLQVLTEFAKLCQQRKKRLHQTEEPELLSRQKDALQKVIYHVLLDLYLIGRRCGAPVVEETIQLIGLNTFHFCGIPDEYFEGYIQRLSESYQNMRFSPSSVVVLRDRLLQLYQGDDPFLYSPAHGYCKVVEERHGPMCRLKSLYGAYPLSLQKVKQLKRKSLPTDLGLNTEREGT